ncbi:MAG: nuclease, partial [Lewinella sp.]
GVFATECSYPFCTPLQLQGVLALLWDGSGTNGGKAVHVRANRDIADLSVYGLGVANNGGGTDGQEFTYPAESVSEGDHILVAREPATLASYFGACYDGYDLVIQADEMNQNGDDGIELFLDMTVIQTYGDSDVDGTGQPWEYSGSWAYKSGGVFRTAGLDCAAPSTTTQNSACVYGFCE